MDAQWNKKFTAALEVMVTSGLKLGEPTIPVVVLLGPKGAGKSYLADRMANAAVEPFNWYFGKVAKDICQHVAEDFINFKDKEQPLYPRITSLGTYRDLLINIGDAMESMQGFVQFQYYMRMRATIGKADFIINDSVRRSWEVDFFLNMQAMGWPVHFVEITGRGQYSDEHKTEANFARALRNNAHKVHQFDNSSSRADTSSRFAALLKDVLAS